MGSCGSALLDESFVSEESEDPGEVTQVRMNRFRRGQCRT